MNNSLFLIFTCGSCFIVAASFIYAGFKALISKRALVFSGRWFFVLIFINYLPHFFNTLTSLLKSDGGGSMHNPLSWLNLLLMMTLLLFFWFQMKGFMVIGASSAYFRTALLHATKSLGLSVEETLSQIKIKETDEKLHVSTQDWVGTAQLRLAGKPSSDSNTLKDIKNAMIAYFQSNPGQMNYATAYLYLTVGVLVMALVVSLGWGAW